MNHLKQKFIPWLITLAFMVASINAAGAFASIFDPGLNGGDNQAKTGIDTLYGELQGSGIAEDQNITEVFFKYVNFFLPYLALIAFLGFIYAGFLYVANFGAEEPLEKAKRVLIWSVVGLLVVVVSYAVVNLFTSDLVQSLNK